MNNDVERKLTLREFFSVLGFQFKMILKYSKSVLPISLLYAVSSSFSPLINIIMTKYIIDELTGSRNIHRLILLALFVVLSNMLLLIVNDTIFNYISYICDRYLSESLTLEIGMRTVSMDYEHIEDAEIQTRRNRAERGLWEQGGLNALIYKLIDVVRSAVTIGGVSYILLVVNPLILLLIIAVVAVKMVFQSHYNNARFQFFSENADNNRKFYYFANLTTDLKQGKDIRIFDATGLILNRFRYWSRLANVNLFRRLAKLEVKYNTVPDLLGELQSAAVYIYLAYRVLSAPSVFTIGSFSMCVGAVAAFSENIEKITKTTLEINFITKNMRLFIDFFFKIPDKMKTGNKEIDLDAPHGIEFKHVSFAYPGAEVFSIKDLSLSIPTHKSLAVVGQNGAGKTTFIKLLLRLYDPTSGVIELDGVDIREYDIEQYRRMFSAVFQDFKLTSFSLRENVAPVAKGTENDQRIFDALNKAGFTERLEELGAGLDTSAFKDFDEQGVEFSGGEQQKIAIARALYKSAEFVVLDEPTAALDPIAEFDIYSRFHELVQNRTSIYISHRLSSCRFCDSIAVFENGSVIELGNHDELMKNDMLYAEMFSKQAKYYV